MILSHKVENIKNNDVNLIEFYSIYVCIYAYCMYTYIYSYIYIIPILCVCLSCDYLVQQKLTLYKCKSFKCCVFQMFTNIEDSRRFCVVCDFTTLMLHI